MKDKIQQQNVKIHKRLKAIIMETQYFIGIDISKKSLNWAVCSANKIILEQASGNDIKSITKTVLNIQRELKFKIASAVFCMEHTAHITLAY
ncbi:MAG: hypothetical protein U0X91_04755 [Spirosomataceae bacterium]